MLEVLNTNTRRQKQHEMGTQFDGCLGGTSLSHCLENKRSPRKVAKDLMAINSSSEISAVSMVMNDLIGELKKAELVGDLVCSSFLHDMIDKGVSLHE